MDFGLTPTDSRIISTYKDRLSWLDRRRCHEPRIRKHEVNNLSNLSWVVFLKTWKRASLASMASCWTYKLDFWDIGSCKMKSHLWFICPFLKCASRSQNILWACQVANLLIVLRVGTVVVAVGPEPQLKQKLIERGIQHESHSHSYSKSRWKEEYNMTI